MSFTQKNVDILKIIKNKPDLDKCFNNSKFIKNQIYKLTMLNF